jgi:hypothetical protein
MVTWVKTQGAMGDVALSNSAAIPRSLIAGAAIFSCLLASVGSASASAGCDAVNNGGFNLFASNPPTPVNGDSATIPGFAAGDTITFTIVSVNAGNHQWLLVGLATLDSYFASASATAVRSYTVTGNQDTVLAQSITRQGGAGAGAAADGTFTTTATCIPAAVSPPAGSVTSSPHATGLSKVVAVTSGKAISDAAAHGIGTAFSGSGNSMTPGPDGITFNFNAATAANVERQVDEAFEALGFMPLDDSGGLFSPQQVAQWNAWLDVRGSGWDRPSLSLAGGQLNVTVGAGYNVMPETVIGVLTGIEVFDYRTTTPSARLSGYGGTVGGYAGGQFTTLRWDATIASSLLSYSASAGAVSGSFGGWRGLASGGLTGELHLADILFEPSSRLFVLMEHDAAYTDSTAKAHAASSFTVGQIALGGKAIYPIESAGTEILPYLGLYADYRFSAGATPPAGQPSAWVGDGLTGRIIAGVDIDIAGGADIGVGAELGGLGADYQSWSIKGRVGASL